jgi:polyferredoxin
MFRQFMERRSKFQKYTSIALPVVLLGGWFYPPLGFFLLLCMAGALGIALFNGRSWCDWMCPRGSFYDLFLKKFSRNTTIPALLRSMSWGNPEAVGLAFVTVLTVTTTAGIVLGAVFQQRAWCHICPMGTLGNWLSKGKKPLYVSENCKDCNLCAKVCPMQLKPYEYKSDIMSDGDCIKCNSCVAACPINALEFKKKIKKAA